MTHPRVSRPVETPSSTYPIHRLAAFVAAQLWMALVLVVGTSLEAQATCPTDNFPTPAAHPANTAYPAPTLSVSCTESSLIVESNGIPSYEFVAITPNDLAAQNHRFVVPRSPEMPAHASDIPLLGTAGFAVNGLPIYGPNEGPFPDPYGDPVYNDIMDECQGHTAQRGDYHYHALLVACLTREAGSGQPSPVIGYASDGFPIYGPKGCLDASCSQVVTFESSWEQIGDPTTYAWDAYQYRQKSGAQYLDECNGRIGPDGTYRYHATSGFPYILGCYAGLDILEDDVGDGGGAGGGEDDGGDDGGGGVTAGAATGTVTFSYEGYLSGEGLGVAEVELVRAQGSSGVLQALLQATPKTASSQDMEESLVVTWADGESGSKTVLLPVTDDSEIEQDESFLLTLEEVTQGASIGETSRAEVTIVDDDQLSTSCIADQNHLCLANGRFQLTVRFVDFDANLGQASVAEYQTADSGFFTFFAAENIELLVKVLDGCGVNQNFWVLGAAATNLGYVLTVFDSATGESYQYDNRVGELSEAIVAVDALERACSG